ncbi:hypothetical protein COY27_01770 [Candidatus Woesearchaeota archaeon CG_4_10_14_0_2_um_filter_33_13]|nr:MAG: hypothetical protein COY27_01770 [Candidatus Woesearchaeota archaeon CG_4_10_14_0_2_um_filter_33_13]
MKDYYTTLEVDPSATHAEIKSAYRRLALQYHPDRDPNNPQSEAILIELNEAYEVLGDDRKKTVYDLSREYQPLSLLEIIRMSVEEFEARDNAFWEQRANRSKTTAKGPSTRDYKPNQKRMDRIDQLEERLRAMKQQETELDNMKWGAKATETFFGLSAKLSVAYAGGYTTYSCCTEWELAPALTNIGISLVGGLGLFVLSKYGAAFKEECTLRLKGLGRAMSNVKVELDRLYYEVNEDK